MNRKDWQEAFGPTPDAFRARVDDTLERLEERDMRKRTKFATTLVAAVLTVTLLAGAAFAATKLDIWEALNYADPLVPLEGADELVVTDLVAAENDYFRVTVQEGVYDGHGAIVKLHVEPKDPDKYVIIAHMAMLSDLDDNYIAEVIEYDDGMTDERITGRKDGKEIIYLSTPDLTVSYEGVDSDSLDIQHLFNTFRDQYNSDGSADFWIDGFNAAVLPDTLNVTLNVRGMDSEDNAAYGTIDNLTFALNKSNAERTVQLIPSEDSNIEGFELVEAKITFTEVRGYISVEYSGSAADDDQGAGVSLRLLDTDGNEFITGNGCCMELDNGHHLWEMEMQSFEEIPETMILEVHIVGESSLGQIVCKVEEIAG